MKKCNCKKLLKNALGDGKFASPCVVGWSNPKYRDMTRAEYRTIMVFASDKDVDKEKKVLEKERLAGCAGRLMFNYLVKI